MAYVTIEDLKGSATVIFFAEVYKKAFSLLKGDGPVLIKGILDVAEDSIKVIASEALLLSELSTSLDSYAEFTLDMDTIGADVLPSLKEVINRYRGGHDGYLRLMNCSYEAIIYLGKNNKIEICENLKREADHILGSNATKFI